MKKLLLFFVLIVCAIHQVRADLVEGKCGDNVYYLWNSDTGELIIKGSGPMFDFDQFDRAPWYGFSRSLKSLVIEYGITHIGDNAFWGCFTFEGHLTLPLSIKSIGDNAFDGCCYFTGLSMGPSIVSIGNHAFNSCSRLEGNLILPECLESIGDGAFNGCSKFTGDLVIPNSVKSIGDNAFCGCLELTGGLYLGESLQSIGEHAFSALNFTGNLYLPKNLKTIGRNAFDGCDGFVGEVVVPVAVSEIDDNTFRSCTGITGVVILGQINRIGNSAFNHCDALTKFVCYTITPPDATDYHVFDNMPLKTVYVPAESVDLYKSALVWKNFEILPIEGAGINDVKGVDVKVFVKDGCLHVDSGESLVLSVSLWSMNGVEVHASNHSTNRVLMDVSVVNCGTYIIQVKTTCGVLYYKVVL